VTNTFVQLTHSDWLSVAPEVVLALTGCLILLLGRRSSSRSRAA
jgi:hypothetical protein